MSKFTILAGFWYFFKYRGKMAAHAHYYAASPDLLIVSECTTVGPFKKYIDCEVQDNAG